MYYVLGIGGALASRVGFLGRFTGSVISFFYFLGVSRFSLSFLFFGSFFSLLNYDFDLIPLYFYLYIYVVLYRPCKVMGVLCRCMFPFF